MMSNSVMLSLKIQCDNSSNPDIIHTMCSVGGSSAAVEVDVKVSVWGEV
jgi:hypothetical protein